MGKPGVTCDACNQYFGQKVESKALMSFPFIGHRIFTGVPTKKGRMPQTLGSLGTVMATGQIGAIELEPRTEELRIRVKAGEVTEMRLIAEITEPLAVCRMLLKIGLELLGKYFYETARSERVAAAREFARRPKRGSGWWFVIKSTPEEYLSIPYDTQSSSIEIIETRGVLCSVMRMPGVSTMIPLELGLSPPIALGNHDPYVRVIRCSC